MAPELTFVNITAPSQLESKPVRRQVRANASAFAWKTRGLRSRLKREDEDEELDDDVATEEDKSDIQLDAQQMKADFFPVVDTSDPGAGWRDPFYTYPVPYQPWMPWMLDYFMNVFIRQGWKAMNITPAEGASWATNTLRICMSEPVFFYVQLFSASGSLAEQNRIPPSLPLWLRGETVKTLNEALNDQARALSNPVIMAVGRIALHEALYGDRDAAKQVHRPAYRWMMNARGGLHALGLPDLTVRLMSWADGVMTALLGPPGDDDCCLMLKDDRSLDLGAVNEYRPGTINTARHGSERLGTAR